MSIQQQQHQPVRYGSSSSTVMSVSTNFDSSSTLRREQNRAGNAEYDPFAIDDDDDDDANSTMKIENEQSVKVNGDIESDSKSTVFEPSKQTNCEPVIVSTSCLPSSTSVNMIEDQNEPIQNNSSVLCLCLGLKFSNNENVENPSAIPDEQTTKDNIPLSNKNLDEQQERRRHSRSPHHHRSSKQSDHRSRSPRSRSHHSLSSSNRKRHRAASPDRPVRTVNAGESAPVTKQYKKSHGNHRNNSRKKSKTNHKHRSSSPPKLESTIEQTKPSTTDEPSKQSHHYQHRHSSRTSHHSRNSSRDLSLNNLIPSEPFSDRRFNANISNSPSSTIHTNLPLDIVESNGRNHLETSTEDRNRIYNRLKNMNERRQLTDAVNNNPLSFPTSNGESQRSRSNLIQIVTTETTVSTTQIPPEVKIDSPISTESTIVIVSANIESSKMTPKKNDGEPTDDMLMEEEMLLEEEEEQQQQQKVKSIDLDSLTIPEISTTKLDVKDEMNKISPAAKTTPTLLTPSPTKKPYTLYKVPHTNHTTPHLSLRNKNQSKKELLTLKSDSSNASAKPQTDENSSRTSLDERISNLLGKPAIGNSSETQIDNRSSAPVNNLQTQTTSTSTPSDKSAESPQDIPSLISTMLKKGDDRSPLMKKIAMGNDERRSITSKHYTSEWLASQKPEQAPPGPEELAALPVPPLVTLPTLVSVQPPTTSPKATVTNSSPSATMIGKLSQAMSKFLTKKQGDNVSTTNEADDAVPMSAKHLERIERRRQREKRQSEIAVIAKEILKPAFRKHLVSKEEYKQIMKKVVTKATQANDVNRIRIGKMIDAYVAKYQASRTISSNTNAP